MPASPTTLFSLIPVTPQPNVDLPSSAFPSLERIQATDTVGRTASNRQMTSLEKRDETMRTKINELIELSLSLDTWFLRRDSTDQKDGNGLTAALRARGYPINQVGAPVVPDDAARLAEINGVIAIIVNNTLQKGGGGWLSQDLRLTDVGAPNLAAPKDAIRVTEYNALVAMIQALQAQVALVKAVPTGAVSAFGNGIPAGWIWCDGTIIYSNNPNWPALIPLRDYLGGVHGGDGVNSFGLPNIVGRTIIGTSYTDQGNLYGIGGRFGVEQHTLTTAQMPVHVHPIAQSQVTPTYGGYGVDGGYDWSLPGPVDTLSAGGGAAHTNTQPSIVLHYGIKI